jgi:hypothetical protein
MGYNIDNLVSENLRLAGQNKNLTAANRHLRQILTTREDEIARLRDKLRQYELPVQMKRKGWELIPVEQNGAAVALPEQKGVKQ